MACRCRTRSDQGGGHPPADCPPERAAELTGPFLPAHREALRRLCRDFLPFATADQLDRLLVDLDERVGGFDDYRRAVLPRLVQLAGALNADLSAWETSPIPPARMVATGLRRLILSTWYGDLDRARAIGYRGALSQRDVEVSWEGPRPRVHASTGPRPLTVTDARTLAAGTSLTTQDCIIGSGAGGSVAAAVLAEAGRDVLVLEAGTWWPAETWDDREGTMMPRLYADQANRSTDDLAIPIFQGVGVGGGTVVNWMMTLRTPDHVLDEWADEHGVEGMSPADMAPVFDEVEREIHATRIADHLHAPNNRLIVDGAAALGWSGAAAVNNARDCVRAGTCGFGCWWGAKQDAVRTWLPRAQDAGARILSDAPAERVERGRVHLPRGVTVQCERVIVAAGAIETPALLRRSGLGTRATGHYLRLHPTTAVAGLYDREMDGSTGIPQSALLDEFAGEGGGYGHWIESAPVHPGIAAFALPGGGRTHRRIMRQFRNMGVLIALTRDGADRRSNGRVWAGRDGRVRIAYRVGPSDRETVRRSMITALRLHQAGGARELITLHRGGPIWRGDADPEHIAAQAMGPNQLGMFSAHPNGTARIGRDGRTSTCRPDGQVHGASGIYVLDGSLMPTAAGVNPQLTIMGMVLALARRLA